MSQRVARKIQARLTHQPNFLATAGVRLFVSHRRLAARKTLPPAAAGWALDSGGFSELSLYGDRRTTARDYNAAVRRYDDEMGKLEWAAFQDGGQHQLESGWVTRHPVAAGKTDFPVLQRCSQRFQRTDADLRAF